MFDFLGILWTGFLWGYAFFSNSRIVTTATIIVLQYIDMILMCKKIHFRRPFLGFQGRIWVYFLNVSGNTVLGPDTINIHHCAVLPALSPNISLRVRH